MISFRYHVVTIVAVFLALAAGVALGGGPLSEIGRGDDAARAAEARTAELEREAAAADDVRSFQDALAASLGGAAIADRLDGRVVSLVVMPGADDGQLESLDRLVRRAGATTGGRYSVQPGLVGLEGASLVDTLGAQLRRSVDGHGVPASATAYERMGGLLARAIATDSDGGAELDGPALEVLSSLEGAELLVPQAQQRRGSVVIVLLGDEPDNPGEVDDLYAGLLAGMARGSDAVVVAGSTTSADGGLLAALREDTRTAGLVSSADSVQTQGGRLVAVLAAASGASGAPGHWGALGNDGASPRG